MLRQDYMNKIVEHKHALLFVGGIATAIVGKKILESQTVKDSATKAMAGVMSAKQNAENSMIEMKKDAEEMMDE